MDYVYVRLFVTQGLWPARFLCSQNSPDNNTGVGCHFLLQGIFPTQGSNPCLLHCRRILYCLIHRGSPCIDHNDWYLIYYKCKLKFKKILIYCEITLINPSHGIIYQKTQPTTWWQVDCMETLPSRRGSIAIIEIDTCLGIVVHLLPLVLSVLLFIDLQNNLPITTITHTMSPPNSNYL